MLAIQTARMQPAILSQTRQDVRLAADLNNLEGHVYDIDMNPPDYEAERVFFLNAPTEVVRHTRRATTQYYRNVASPGRIIDYRRTTYLSCYFRRSRNVICLRKWNGFCGFPRN